ncbi:MAG: glutathione S-transferase, partial [Acidiferrobacteraceae bacterium]|nr:glutathione S-transferase [Acidiferrobacteraceae bacterium]
MELTFIYFDFPFWRAEVGKIALFMGGIDFENKIVDGEEFQRVKETGQLDDGTVIPFHQL